MLVVGNVLLVFSLALDSAKRSVAVKTAIRKPQIDLSQQGQHILNVGWVCTPKTHMLSCEYSELNVRSLALSATDTWLKIKPKPIFHCDAKPFALGPRVGLDPKHHNFALRIPTCWYLKMLKFALPTTRTLKFALPPNASRWNIGGVGSPMRGAGIGHVYFMFVSISFALGGQRELSFQWNMGLTLHVGVS